MNCIVLLLSLLSGFSVTAPWAFIWFLDGNQNKVDICIVGTNGKCFLINAHGVFRRMGAVTEIPGNEMCMILLLLTGPGHYLLYTLYSLKE